MAASRQALAAKQPHDGDVDPVYEWLDDGGSYLLRLNLPGFKKENFRVHVDTTGRLTVMGQGAPVPGAGAGRAPRLHKAFQLPNTANLDAITGRFDGAVLTLTVPKLQQQQPGAAAAPLPAQTGEEQPAGEAKDLQKDKAAAPEVDHAPAETERRIEAEWTSLTVRGKEEEDKLKAEAAPHPPLQSEKANGARRDQDEAARPEDHRARVAREAARRIEAARARVAEAKAAAERAGGQWKERAAAEGIRLAESIGKNKEVIATAVAAFALIGVVSHRLFSRS